jgi:hypothetical protein
LKRLPAATAIISAFVLGGTGIASAGVIGTFAYAAVDPGTLGTLQSDEESTSATTAITNGTYGSGTFTAQATASAAFGTLKGFASADLSDYAPNSYTTTGGACPYTYCGPSGTGPVRLPSTTSASFTDTFTLSGASGSAWLRLKLAVDGTSSFTSDDPDVNFNSDSQGNLEVIEGGTYYGSWGFFGGTYDFLTDPIPVTFGVPVTLTVSTEATVDLIDAVAAGNYDASGTADFSHTVTLDTVNAYSDAGGTDPYGNFTVTSGSGTTYPTNASATPEPGTWLLLLAAAVATGIWQRSFRRAARTARIP